MQGGSSHHAGTDMARTAHHSAIIGNVVGWLGAKRASPSRCRCVALTAIVYRSDMARILAYCLDAIMTGRARASCAVRILCGEPG